MSSGGFQWGLMDNSTSVPVSQQSWVLMKGTVTAKKKGRKKSRESAKEDGILLVVLSCCAPPSVALGRVAVLVGGNVTFPPALV